MSTRKPNKTDYLILSQLSASTPKMLDEIIDGIPRAGIRKIPFMDYDVMEVSEYLHSYISSGLVTKVVTEEVMYNNPVKKFMITNKGIAALNKMSEPEANYLMSADFQFA